ncbi:hypothetical protein PR048_023989 [Dryococelus australis]|uniref:Uncharacterized protein n=1 Tax=Dryococelus australis TaxID=614101 RepID=A0ABQ9GVM1_9NEOP|nr:hypothetical protein PR048_023989 [Dryococelus australis]
MGFEDICEGGRELEVWWTRRLRFGESVNVGPPLTTVSERRLGESLFTLGAEENHTREVDRAAPVDVEVWTADYVSRRFWNKQHIPHLIYCAVRKYSPCNYEKLQGERELHIIWHSTDNTTFSQRRPERHFDVPPTLSNVGRDLEQMLDYRRPKQKVAAEEDLNTLMCMQPHWTMRARSVTLLRAGCETIGNSPGIHQRIRVSIQCRVDASRSGLALNIVVLRTNEGEDGGKREIPDKTRRPAASSATIPTCEYPGATPSGIETGLPGWEASSLTTTPPRSRRKFVSCMLCSDFLNQILKMSHCPFLHIQYDLRGVTCPIPYSIWSKICLINVSSGRREVPAKCVTRGRGCVEDTQCSSPPPITPHFPPCKTRRDTEIGQSHLRRQSTATSVNRRFEAMSDGAGMNGWEIPEKTRRPTASSGTIPTCENPATRPGIERGLPWWEASVLIAQPPRPQLSNESGGVSQD